MQQCVQKDFTQKIFISISFSLIENILFFGIFSMTEIYVKAGKVRVSSTNSVLAGNETYLYSMKHSPVKVGL